MKNKSTPKCIRWGSASVKIYTCDDKGVPLHAVTYYDHNKVRHKKSFRNLEEAEHEAKCIAEQLAKAEPKPLMLRDSDRYAYRRATELLQPFGIPVDVAVFHLVEALKLIPLTEIVQAARHFGQSAKKIMEKPVKEVVEEYIGLKSLTSRYHLKDVRSRLNRFAKSFNCSISHVSSDEIQEFLQKLVVTARTRNNYRAVIGGLFNHARKRSYVPPDHPGVNHIAKIPIPPKEVEVFTVDEISLLLNGASEELLAALAIAAFAGVRTEEIKRLQWDDVNLTERHIVIRAANAKTKRRRLVPISDNLHAWLKPLYEAGSKVVRYAVLGNQFLKLAARVKLKWKRNGLRHSFVSYRLALLDNVHKVAREAGNSPRIIETNYEKCVTREEAKRYFAVYPNRQTIIPMPGIVHAEQALGEAANQ